MAPFIGHVDARKDPGFVIRHPGRGYQRLFPIRLALVLLGSVSISISLGHCTRSGFAEHDGLHASRLVGRARGLFCSRGGIYFGCGRGDMNARQTTHFIGIGGTGLSAIARVLVERGEHVTGSDLEDSVLAKSLRQIGVTVNIGHSASHVNCATRVIRSSAVGEDNVEVQAARLKGVPVYKRSEFLGELLANQQVIAVAGSHGKTTTTAMIAWMLTALNQKPGYIIGSVAQNLGTNAAAGAGRLFVIEADEYDYMFLGLNPKIAVVTNVEHDHPDLFPTAQDFQFVFQKFVDRL